MKEIVTENSTYLYDEGKSVLKGGSIDESEGVQGSWISEVEVGQRPVFFTLGAVTIKGNHHPEGGGVMLSVVQSIEDVVEDTGGGIV